MTKMGSFTFYDYAVLLIILTILSAIGLYYRYTGGKQSSTEEYLLGDRNQGVLPVALSLVASHMSGISILGVPAEVYFRGAIYSVANIALLIVIPVTVHLFLPVFFKVASMSVYEYLELRFGRHLRVLASLAYPVQSVLFMAVVLYAPALALETLSGLSTTWSILVVGSVCTFYSTVGGIKAVIMTDVFQFILTNLAVLTIILTVYLEKGSFINIWTAAKEGGRLNFSNFSLDPTERHTWWSLIIGATFTYMGTYAVHQSQVQRYLTLRDHRTALRTLYVSWPITTAFSLSMIFAGLCIYSKYQGCDPLMAHTIRSEDQLVPYFVVDTLSSCPGIPGLVVAGIFSASLSSISANLNSLATVSVQDYIRPLYQQKKKLFPTDKWTLWMTKLLACLYGCLLMVITYLARYMRGILQTGLTLAGLMGGPMVAVYTLGLFVPAANEPGAIAALLSGLAISVWLSFGGPKPPIVNLQSSTYSCLDNITTTSDLLTRPGEYFYLYRLSYWWSVVLSCLLAFTIGWLVSLYTTAVYKFSCNTDPELFSPPVMIILNKRKQSLKENISSVIHFENKKQNIN
ncbi:putative sodium-dependent multivitamin transporter isoform X2 [Homalodisca vitripennis]|uniref:putative sodium-dependent multivitamin transporter isoform X2 n=1 Tax=Homalodisca vitripennis TaxID=197043 RepID=UPI001EEB3B27|nr:putative sodium-dependent multivitamin transporter isoform X2 [Homalodisca vitripennis]